MKRLKFYFLSFLLSFLVAVFVGVGIKYFLGESSVGSGHFAVMTAAVFISMKYSPWVKASRKAQRPD